jgi:hypothetical protein
MTTERVLFFLDPRHRITALEVTGPSAEADEADGLEEDMADWEDVLKLHEHPPPGYYVFEGQADEAGAYTGTTRPARLDEVQAAVAARFPSPSEAPGRAGAVDPTLGQVSFDAYGDTGRPKPWHTLIRGLLSRAQAVIDMAPPAPPVSDPQGPRFYQLSVKSSKSSDGVLLWECTNWRGYTFRLEQAGRFTEAEIAQHYGNDDGENARAVPTALVESLWERADEVQGRGMDYWRDGHEHVVPFVHLKTLRKPHRDAAKKVGDKR